MNSQNIAALAAQLSAVGVENAMSALLRRICFHPQTFALGHTTVRSTDSLRLLFFFDRTGSDFDYILTCYEASLLRQQPETLTAINGVDVKALQDKMASIDWRHVEERTSPVVLDDKTTWETEAGIETVVTRLAQLDATTKGKAVADRLRQKYWAAMPAVFTSTINALKDKSDISQRFYWQEGQSLISLEEAYRFLLNKRQEKQLLEEKRRVKAPRSTNDSIEAGAVAGNGSRHKRGGRSQGPRKRAI